MPAVGAEPMRNYYSDKGLCHEAPSFQKANTLGIQQHPTFKAAQGQIFLSSSLLTLLPPNQKSSEVLNPRNVGEGGRLTFDPSICQLEIFKKRLTQHMQESYHMRFSLKGQGKLHDTLTQKHYIRADSWKPSAGFGCVFILYTKYWLGRFFLLHIKISVAFNNKWLKRSRNSR